MRKGPIRSFDPEVIRYVGGKRSGKTRRNRYNRQTINVKPASFVLSKFIDQARYIVDFFKELLFRNGNTDEERRALVAEMVNAAGYGDMLRATPPAREASQRPPLTAPIDFSNNPPMKWRHRPIRRESPPDFIQREYADWLGKGLVQSDIRRYDRDLYQALASWQYRTGSKLPEEFGLPTKAGLTDKLLARVIDPETTLHDGERWRSRVKVRLNNSQDTDF